ncbi:MAG: MYXO-CTERM sorting domain-containing protein [Bacteroidota bacterium]
MKTNIILAAASAMVFLTSCEAIGGIFKAGMGVGIFLVLLVVILIAWLLLRRRK